jgi:hypothetical protein
MNPAYAALDKLKVSIKTAQLKRAKPQEGKADIRQVGTTREETELCGKRKRRKRKVC